MSDAAPPGNPSPGAPPAAGSPAPAVNPFDAIDPPRAEAPSGNPFDTLDPVDPRAVHSGPAADTYWNRAGSTLRTMGHDFMTGYGAHPTGISPEGEQWLRENGLWGDVEKHDTTIWKRFNEGAMRPAAAAFDFLMRAPIGVYHAAAEEVARTYPWVPRDVLAVPEAFPRAGHEIIGTLPHANFPGLGPDLRIARELGIVGRGEDGWLGTKRWTREEIDAEARLRQEAAGAQAQLVRRPRPAAEPEPVAAPPVEAPAAPAAPPVAAPARAPDVHAIARRLEPDLFGEYDALAARKDSLRGLIDDLQTQRRQGTSPEIERLETEIDRMRAARLEAPPAERAAMANAVTALEQRLAEAHRELHAEGDTAAIARVRQDLVAADLGMRDRAADVSAATRRAEAERAAFDAAPPPEPVTPVTPVTPEPAAPAVTPVTPVTQAVTPAVTPEVAPPRPVPVEVIDRAAMLEGHLDDRGTPDMRAAAEAVVARVEAALAEGRPVHLVVDGQATPIARVAEGGLIDDRGNPRGLRGLTHDQVGANRIEIGPTPQEAAAAPPAPVRATPEQRAADAQTVAQDVVQKMVAAGMSAEDAAETGALWAARYQARADWLGGAQGSAAELYRAEGADIRASGRRLAQPEAGRELAQGPRPLGTAPRERALTVLDILDGDQAPAKPRSRDVRAIAAQLLERGQDALRKLGVNSGVIDEASPRGNRIIARAIAAEVKAALARTGNAGDWYSAKVEAAVQIAARLYPEVATDPNARMAFTAAMAVTSQGETVVSNVRLADRIYTEYRETGRFPTQVDAKNGAAMAANFAKLNRFLDAAGPDGPTKLREFMAREFTVRELEEISGEAIGGENKDTKVYGSAILGPKIGGGFYQNLNGNFSPVTMDLWFMRGWGRLTGTLVGLSEEALAKQHTRLAKALQAAGETVPPDPIALEARAEQIVAQHERDFRSQREKYDSGEIEKSELTKAAERYVIGLRGINEQPRSGGDRIWMRQVVEQARRMLAREGVDLTPADLQAAWWYPEKDLYAKLGGRPSAGVNVDYQTAWGDLARSRGISDADIADAAGPVRALDRRPGSAAGADERGAAGQVRRGSPEADGAPAEPRVAGEEGGPSEGREFYQDAEDVELEQSRRGSVTFPADGSRPVIRLLRDRADASTVHHEFAHVTLEELMRDAAGPNAPPQLVADAGAVRDWLGVEDGKPIPTAAHEKFARGFEAYLMEGHAPTTALARVFAYLKQALITLYKTAEALGVDLTPEIRRVYDRLLAGPDDAVVAPERAPPETFARLHESDAAHAAPPDAAAIADNIRAERLDIEEAAHPEIADGRPGRAGEAAAAAGGSGAGHSVLPGVRDPGGDIGAQPGGSSGSGAVGPGRGGSPPEGDSVSGGGASGGGSAGPRTEPPASPRSPIDAGDRLVDRAGNIRLDNIEGPEDLREAYRRSAARNNDFWTERRGVLSDAEVLELSEVTGLDPAFLDRKAIGAAYNAEELLAARRALLQRQTRVRDAMARANETRSPEDVVALAEEIKRYELEADVAQAKVAGATAEWGRAGRALRFLKADAGEGASLDALLKQASGRSFNQLLDLAKWGSSLETTADVGRLVQETAGGRARRAVIYYYLNTLLSGPITQTWYAVGNALDAIYHPVILTPLAAARGAAREALGFEGAADRVYLGESAAELYGLIKGAPDAWRNAWQVMRTGEHHRLPGERGLNSTSGIVAAPPIPGAIGTAIGIPGRVTGAGDAFFKTLRYSERMQAEAYRAATREGVSGEAFDQRVAELTRSPTDAMMDAATASSLHELYMRPTDYDSLVGRLTRVINHPSGAGLALKVFIPFLKVGAETTRNAFVDQTPLGLLSPEIRQRLVSGTAAGDLQAAKITAGVGLLAGTVAMALQGVITGDGPTDPAKRSVWLLNHRPTSVQVGGMTFNYAQLGSRAMLLRFAANLVETVEGWDHSDAGTDKLVSAAVESVAHSVLSENWMKGVSDVLQAVFHPQQYGPSWARNFALSWMPYSTGLGQVARGIDEYSRDAPDFWAAARSRIPVASQILQPRVDMFGRPIPQSGRYPAGLPRYEDDPTVQELDRLHVGIGRIDRKIRGVPLTEEQYHHFSVMSGELVREHLDNLIALPAYQSLPPEVRTDKIHALINKMHEAARGKMMLEYPDIVAQAQQIKIDHATGVKSGAREPAR